MIPAAPRSLILRALKARRFTEEHSAIWSTIFEVAQTTAKALNTRRLPSGTIRRELEASDIVEAWTLEVSAQKLHKRSSTTQTSLGIEDSCVGVLVLRRIAEGLPVSGSNRSQETAIREARVLADCGCASQDVEDLFEEEFYASPSMQEFIENNQFLSHPYYDESRDLEQEPWDGYSPEHWYGWRWDSHRPEKV